MTEKYILAQKVARSLAGAPIIYSGGRDVVQITFEMDTYSSMLKLLKIIEEEDVQVVEQVEEKTYRRNRI